MKTSLRYSSHYQLAFHLFLLYVIVLLLNGYSYGGGDMTETLSLLAKQFHPELFPHDLYVSTMEKLHIHERMPFVKVLGLWNAQPETWALLLHALCSLVLFSGMYKISSLYIHSPFLRWALLFFVVVVLRGIHLGGNEIYDLQLAPSFPAKAAGVWAIYFFIKDRSQFAVCFLLVAVFFQPLVAAQLLLLFALVAGLLWLRGKLTLGQKWGWAAMLSLPSIAYLLVLMQYHQSVPMAPERYFQIIHLRMDHHFFPAAFGVKNYVIYSVLLVSALLYFYRKERRLFLLALGIASGCFVYSLGVYFEIKTALLTQWFKSTLWLELLGGIALFAWIDSLFRLRIHSGLFLGAILALAGLFAFFSWPPLHQKTYDFGSQWRNHPVAKAAEEVKEKTHVDALFLIPPTVSHFRHVAQRSVYVDFKSISHNTPYLIEWSRRVEQVYGLDAFEEGREGGFECIPKAQEYYLHLTESQLSEFQLQSGITHMLTEKGHALDFPVLIETDNYLVYSLR